MILQKEQAPPAPYVHQSHPKVKYGPNRATKVVKDAATERELGKEWTDTPHPPETEEEAEAVAAAAPKKSKK